LFPHFKKHYNKHFFTIRSCFLLQHIEDEEIKDGMN
jgi:hypothetical protein